MQERAYVTGLKAANLAINILGHGKEADIIPVSHKPSFEYPLPRASKLNSLEARSIGQTSFYILY